MDFNGNLEMNGITKERKYRNQKKKKKSKARTLENTEFMGKFEGSRNKKCKN